jgi:hypothetical protein
MLVALEGWTPRAISEKGLPGLIQSHQAQAVMVGTSSLADLELCLPQGPMEDAGRRLGLALAFPWLGAPWGVRPLRPSLKMPLQAPLLPRLEARGTLNVAGRESKAAASSLPSPSPSAIQFVLHRWDGIS